jgi:hypothetical protein
VKRAPLAFTVAVFLSGTAWAEDTTAWLEVVKADDGEVYLIDPATITETTYKEQSVRQATILVRGYKGQSEIDELWGVYLVHCRQHAWRSVLSGGKKRDGSGLITMALMPEGQFRIAPEGSPMRAVTDKVCNSEIKAQ